jgi:purine-nucleoside phosphorylase
MKNYLEALAYIHSKITEKYELCVVLGSGYSELISNLSDIIVIDYCDIPNFPVSTVAGHSGQMIFAKLNHKNVIFMSGRTHFYEGYQMERITFYVRVLKLLGIKTLVLTNATGGINENFVAGDLVVIKDHIKLDLQSPLFGANLESFGERFPDMSEAYSLDLIEKAKQAFHKNGIEFKTGVYAFMGGPQFETPAEIKMLKILGADMVGMSTVPEVIVANHCKINVLGISLISNLAAGIAKNALSHQEVMEEGKKAMSKFWRLLGDIVS